MTDKKRLPSGKEVPIIPPLPPGEPDIDPNPIVAVCGECRLEIRQMMAYSCPRSRCPAGLGSSVSMSFNAYKASLARVAAAKANYDRVVNLAEERETRWLESVYEGVSPPGRAPEAADEERS